MLRPQLPCGVTRELPSENYDLARNDFLPPIGTGIFHAASTAAFRDDNISSSMMRYSVLVFCFPDQHIPLYDPTDLIRKTCVFFEPGKTDGRSRACRYKTVRRSFLA